MTNIDDKKLSQFILTTKKLIESRPQMNEPNTKVKVINPFLQILGWDLNFDVELEYPVRVGSTTAKVDYALLIQGRPAVFIEAKGFDTIIGNNEEKQAISYGRYEGVKWAAVMNGKSIHIFNTKYGKDPEDCLIARINIDEFIEKKKTLWLLSKESVQSKETDSIAETIKQTRNFIADLETNKKEISQKIANVLKKIADKSLYRRIEEISEEVLVNLIQGLKATPKKKIAIEKPKILYKSDLEEIERNSIMGNPNDEVVVFPAREDGVKFLLKYRAWGFVRTNRRPKYLALYVGKPYSSVLYFGEIDSISNPFSSKDEIKGITEEDKVTFTPGKRVIYLKKDSLVKFSNPIKMGGRYGWSPRGQFSTNLERIKTANTTKELSLK